MGSSGEAANKGIDASVGGLVWVRRRNGSWWPGRILGLDEVSESCVVSPRSGTPVKLLGREDASVDWYNLEKSKRVKSFRCGEYEDCIAKAKASAANSSKKAVKYARREDAIIHALEIENSRLGNDHTDAVGDSSVHENGTSAREPASNDDEDDVSDLEKNSDSAQELSQSGLSFEEPNHLSSSKVQSMQGRRRTPNDSEDDGTEGVKRMRGLEDLGVGVGATNRKGQTGGLLELVQQDNASIANSNNANSSSNGNTVNGRTQVGSSLKRKRTQVASANEFLKKKNRRRPLTKVLESTPMVDVRVLCDPPRKVSGLEATELKKSGSERNGVSRENGSSVNALEPTRDIGPNKQSEVPSTSGSAENGSSHRLFDVPFVEERRQSAGLPSEAVRFPFDKPLVCGLKSQSSPREGALIGSTSSGALHANIGERLEKGTSKWQLKGKRNSRKLGRNRKPSRKYADSDEDSKGCLAGLENGFGKKIGCNGITVSSDSRDCRGLRLVDQEDGSKSLTSPDGSLPPQRQLPYRQSRFTVHSRFRMSDLSTKNSPSDSSLYEIKIEMKTSDRPPHVPLVSLMSKLTGKAVVGHPITVEVLEDELCDGLMGSAVDEELEDNNSRADHIVGSVKGRTTTKHSVSRPQQHSPRPNLSPKGKKSGLLPKKIRKLSSLTGGKKSEERKTTTAAAAAVAEKPKGPVIACIPLKLVFSRMSEAVNGTARQTNRAC